MTILTLGTISPPPRGAFAEVLLAIEKGGKSGKRVAKIFGKRTDLFDKVSSR